MEIDEKRIVTLIFWIYNKSWKIGEVKIPILKKEHIEKWKNPQLVEAEAIAFFREKNNQYYDREYELSAIHVADELKK